MVYPDNWKEAIKAFYIDGHDYDAGCKNIELCSVCLLYDVNRQGCFISTNNKNKETNGIIDSCLIEYKLKQLGL